jgi:hypothetical protein
LVEGRAAVLCERDEVDEDSDGGCEVSCDSVNVVREFALSEKIFVYSEDWGMLVCVVVAAVVVEGTVVVGVGVVVAVGVVVTTGVIVGVAVAVGVEGVGVVAAVGVAG